MQKMTHNCDFCYGTDSGRWVLSAGCDGYTLLTTQDGQQTDRHRQQCISGSHGGSAMSH